jgi:hypothetical protein
MRRKPIGQILVEKGDITEEHLTAALEEQDRSGRRLGEILIEQGHTSWLALARALAEQVLDINAAPPEEPAPAEDAKPDALEMVRAMAERVASLPPVPDPLPPPEPLSLPAPAPAPASAPDPEHELAREVAHQVASLELPAPETKLLHLTPRPRVEAETGTRLETIEALLKERQRAFMELFTTAETLRMKVARLEEIIEERDRELAKLRIARAV